MQAAYWTGPDAEYQPMLVSQMVDAFWESEQGAALQTRLQSEPERSEEGELTGLQILQYTARDVRFQMSRGLFVALMARCCMMVCRGLLLMLLIPAMQHTTRRSSLC